MMSVDCKIVAAPPQTTPMLRVVVFTRAISPIQNVTVVSQAIRWKISSVASQSGAIQPYQIRQMRLHENVPAHL